jgi:hypothetical protein
MVYGHRFAYQRGLAPLGNKHLLFFCQIDHLLYIFLPLGGQKNRARKTCAKRSLQFFGFAIAIMMILFVQVNYRQRREFWLVPEDPKNCPIRHPFESENSLKSGRLNYPIDLHRTLPASSLSVQIRQYTFQCLNWRRSCFIDLLKCDGLTFCIFENARKPSQVSSLKLFIALLLKI